jgi:hypothetical protein
LREAVQQNDQRAIAFDYSSQPDAVRLNHLEITVLHISSQLVLANQPLAFRAR